MRQKLIQGCQLTPRIRGFDNSDYTSANGDNSITNNNDSQETHSLHQVGSLKTQYWEYIGYGEGKDDLNTSEDIPRHEDVAVVVGETECDAEIDHSEDKVQANL